ncbi:unnamed protein product [Bursaphelenchus okinawaensis]|uniref:E3 ubiquitin protein ligase n=1 Tax=Bursaphelenchus okinawaensis TaxID=465554 RepID=A0A811K3W7_9BILA|nr:unnamed protein product [Bursaphelenchus okinawaensis]CAG9091229.1 unnamed protein product [Bursaphelenchus okinawaensis]
MSQNEENKSLEKAIIFETIRLPSVYNVATLNDKVLRAQHYKLSQKFRVKQRQINQLEKRIEELENVHAYDDQLICALNRQWNLLDDMLMDILKQKTVEELEATNSTYHRLETNFLTLISELNTEEVTDKLDKRVHFSNEAFTRLLRCINGISQRRDKILSVLAKKDKEDVSMDEEISQTSTDLNNDHVKEIDPLLRQELSEALAENKRLEAQVLLLTTEKTKYAHALALKKDEKEVTESTKDNLKSQLEDAKFELTKSISKEEKLESQIIELKRQLDLAKVSPVKDDKDKEDKSKPEGEATQMSSKEVEELQAEVEVQTELAEKRLTELNALNTQNQELAAKIVELNNAIKFLPTSVIQGSPDFIVLTLKYTNLVEEAKRVDRDNAILKNHIIELRQSYDAQVADLKSEFTIGMERLRENCTVMSSELLSVKKECTLMELEFKQKYESDALEARNYKEMKRYLVSLNGELKRKTEESDRHRKELKKLREDLDKVKKETDIKPKIEHIEIKAEPIKEEPPQTPEGERYKKEINRLTKQNEKLQKQIDSYANSEQGLMSEIENTATAVEELMSQNTALTERITEQEEACIKMVKDALQNESICRTYKQGLEVLEQKLKTVESARDTLSFELQQHAEKSEVCKQTATLLESSTRRLNEAYENSRQSLVNLNVELSELKIRHEKQSAELQDLKQQLKEKVQKMEGSRTKINRLKEEKSVLKKKLHRAKQAADCENFDELLMEENKMLRESLACPSCKTGDKNTVLTKCFHVFCMECVKKRYDGRSRKCPKCNAAFGANDFHRIYIE